MIMCSATSHLPDAHAEHEDDPAAEYLPAVQVAHAVEAVDAVAALNFPAGHAVHELWPVEAWYRPAVQMVQEEAADAEYLATLTTETSDVRSKCGLERTFQLSTTRTLWLQYQRNIFHRGMWSMHFHLEPAHLCHNSIPT
jgi:hypothetical protein